MLRSLTWGSNSSSSGTASDSDPQPPSPERHHRRHHRPHRHGRLSGHHEKNYEILPLGGNRPIGGGDDDDVDLEKELRRHRRRERRARRHHSSRSSEKSRSEDAEEDAAPTPSSEASARSSRHSKRDGNSDADEGGVARTESAKTSKRSSAPAIVIDDHQDVAAGGVPITHRHTISTASSSPSKSPPSSPQLHQGSSMGIVISEGRSRRETDGSETNTPYITTTPPTPSPLEQARRRNTKPHFAVDVTVAPPYPVTPPATDMPVERTSYLPYHPPSPTSPTSPTLPASDIHPALRPAALRPSSRARTVPSQSPLDRVAAAVEIGSSDSIPQVPRRKSTRKEDPYLLLRRFDTVIVVDDSLSMGEHWAATQSALETVATVALKHDQDGIDIHFMNHPEKSAWNVKSATHIRRLFSEVEPDGCTPTGECLDDILRDYLDRYAQTKLPASPSSTPDGEHRQPSKIKPLNIVVLTDGEPTDDPESVIVSAARRLEALNAPLHQVGIQFLQIGDRPDAREALEELDDHLADVYGIRDIVDTTQYGGGDGKEGITGEMLLKALLGGINRKWDRK